MDIASTAVPESHDAALSRVVLLQDKTGRIQVILPQHAMLDLKSIQSETGRELVAVSQIEIDELYDSKRLSQLINFEELHNVTTIVDKSVFAEQLHLAPVIADETDNSTATSPVTIQLEELTQALLAFDHDVLPMEVAIDEHQLTTSTPNPDSNADQIIHSLKSFTSIRIKQRLEDTLEIPTLPQTAQRIIHLRVNPNAVVSELSEIVESDPSLAAQVVSWAASPYYAAPGKIRSVQDAIVRVLGFDLVGNLALGLALGKTLDLPKDKVDGITPYWLQSIYCSTLVESIAKLIPPELKPSKGLTYLAGLLHNFGYLVLAHIFPPHFSQICRYIEANPHISHMAIEHHVLQITREQICVWLLQLWNMPDEISTAVRYQHDPSYDGDNCAYPNLIYMALRLLRQAGIGDAPLEEVPAYLYEKFELCPDEVQAVVQQLIESDEEIKEIASHFPDGDTSEL